MRRPGGNHVDRRRLLLPADYATYPHRFGVDLALDFIVPPGGDTTSRDVARIQHQLVATWRRRDGAPTAAALARRFGISKQTFSRATLGQRWMGETVMAALVHALRTAPRPPGPMASR